MGHTNIKQLLLAKLERPCQLKHLGWTENYVLPTGNTPEV